MTGNSTDVALQGQRFFAVQKEGTLVDSAGNPVLDTAHKLIAMRNGTIALGQTEPFLWMAESWGNSGCLSHLQRIRFPKGRTNTR